MTSKNIGLHVVFVFFCKRLGPFFSKQTRLGVIFSWILPRFSGILLSFQGFCPDFQRFCPDFRQIKTFGGALAPPSPTPLGQHTLLCQAYDYKKHAFSSVSKRKRTDK